MRAPYGLLARSNTTLASLARQDDSFDTDMRLLLLRE